MTATEIGRRLGVSKDSVCGKVRRLGLEGRSSPIRPKGARHAAKISRAMRDGHSIVKLALSIGPPPKHCQWIEGEPSANDACKCGAPVLPEFSYCAEHVYRAYLLPTPKLRVKALMKVAA